MNHIRLRGYTEISTYQVSDCTQRKKEVQSDYKRGETGNNQRPLSNADNNKGGQAGPHHVAKRRDDLIQNKIPRTYEVNRR